MTDLPDDARKRIATALDYHRRSWRVIASKYRGKEPTDRDWPNICLAEDRIAEVFSMPRNISVVLGKASGGLTDLDLDVPQAAMVAAALLPATARFSHQSKPGSHYLYVVRGEIESRRFQAPDHTTLMEVRFDRAQTVMPGSIHASGEPITWENDVLPLEIEAVELMRLAAMVAAATLLARSWPAPGARHDASLALGGALLRLS